MIDKHPEIAWGVTVETDLNSDSSFVCISGQTSQFIEFKLNDIWFRVFALKDKRDEEKV